MLMCMDIIDRSRLGVRRLVGLRLSMRMLVAGVRGKMGKSRVSRNIVVIASKKTNKNNVHHSTSITKNLTTTQKNVTIPNPSQPPIPPNLKFPPTKTQSTQQKATRGKTSNYECYLTKQNKVKMNIIII